MSRIMTDKELVDLMAAAPHNFTIIKPLPRAECSDYVRGYVLDPLPDLELNGVPIRNVAGEVIALVEQKRAIEAQRDELLAALESLVLFTNPKPSNAVALNNAHQVIARVKGGVA